VSFLRLRVGSLVSEEPSAVTEDVDCVREDELRRDEVVNCGVL
jgi:hypothetical protein